MNSFDTFVDQVDSIHQQQFAVDVLVDGLLTKGIFDEVFDVFEGVDSMYRTLELPMSVLPLAINDIETDVSTVELISDGRKFRIKRPVQQGKIVTLELGMEI